MSSPAPVPDGPSEGPTDGRRRYAGQTADERDAARRARLLAVIHDVVGTQGYRALAVERVCTRANVSTRHFYQLYEGKEAAFADLYDELLLRSGTKVLESLEATAGDPLAERVPAALLAFLRPVFEDLRTARIVFVEVVGLSARIENTRLRNREKLVELIEAESRAAVVRGEVVDRDWRLAALSLIGAATAVALDWMIHKDRRPLAELEDHLAALAVTLLTADPAPRP
ncbi:TetR/AcrR family transcriptional regulator [Nocardioides stalactiti]|uniref:TetR/AcrR family transcriptional regulator n=1 Tax=Nocardioides stalactiti TaxID=2755356 RepID=UPI00160218A9|nr:TetR/AcrR family transcriptional regulator [Nocardioides stalactiti]